MRPGYYVSLYLHKKYALSSDYVGGILYLMENFILEFGIQIYLAS